MDWLARLLQSSDSFFPSGGFSHSLGLEGMVQLNLVHDPETLAGFLRDSILPALENVELPYLARTFNAAAQENCERLRELDVQYSAMKMPRELREASERIGTQRLAILREISPDPLLDRLAEMQIKNAAIIFGAQCAVGGAPLEAALSAWVYQTLAAAVSASMKLIRIGHLASQKILTQSLAQSQPAINRALLISESDIGWFNPLLEIGSARHEFADARLFIS